MLKTIEAWFARGVDALGRARGPLSLKVDATVPSTPRLSARDFARLERLASIELHGTAAREMLSLLERCHVLPMGHIGGEIVQLGSRVSFDIDSSAPIERRLVPLLKSRALLDLPVIQPLGLALIGREAGDVVVARRDSGELATVMIHSVSNDKRGEH